MASGAIVGHHAATLGPRGVEAAELGANDGGCEEGLLGQFDPQDQHQSHRDSGLQSSGGNLIRSCVSRRPPVGQVPPQIRKSVEAQFYYCFEAQGCPTAGPDQP